MSNMSSEDVQKQNNQQPEVKKQKPRKVKPYLAMEPIVDVDLKGAVKPLEGWDRSSRMEDLDKYLEANKIKILDRYQTDEVQIAVFPPPIIKTIKRETKVTVS